MLATQTAYTVSLASAEGSCNQRKQGCFAPGLHPTPASRHARNPLSKQAVRMVCNATDTADKPTPENLAGEEKERWQDGLQQLIGLGMDDVLAEKSLKRGFGWSSQAYWWKDKVNEVPKLGEVQKPACSSKAQL
ncbi:hypothetical protein ABBQ32_012387 [Trebouxia sp. C0010 RCD-2024]